MRGRELKKERKAEGIEIPQGRRERGQIWRKRKQTKWTEIGAFYTRVRRSVVYKSVSGGVLC